MKLKQVVLASALACGASASMAIPVTVVGGNFDISYDSASVGLFGTPTLVGNVLAWFPSGSPGFTAETGSGVDVTHSTFAVQITAHPGYQLSSFSLTEGGDYFYFGNGTGVAATGQLRITPLPGSTTAVPIAAGAPFTANTALDFTTQNWTASAATAALPAGITWANATVQSLLAAYVTPQPLGYAFIEQKEAFLTVGVNAVPEPQTWALMFAGLGVVGFLGARRGGGS